MNYEPWLQELAKHMTAGEILFRQDPDGWDPEYWLVRPGSVQQIDPTAGLAGGNTSGSRRGPAAQAANAAMLGQIAKSLGNLGATSFQIGGQTFSTGVQTPAQPGTPPQGGGGTAGAAAQSFRSRPVAIAPFTKDRALFYWPKATNQELEAFLKKHGQGALSAYDERRYFAALFLLHGR